jgi:hypothetical protein
MKKKIDSGREHEAENTWTHKEESKNRQEKAV